MAFWLYLVDEYTFFLVYESGTVLISNNFMKAQIWWMKQKSHILD